MLQFPETVRYKDGAVEIIDQTLLPLSLQYLRLVSVEQVREAIAALRVRGAPAIGVAAAFGLCLAAEQSAAQTPEQFRADVMEARGILASARPTAVNLFGALDKMTARLDGAASVRAARAALLECATALAREDEDVCRAIGRHGLALLRDGMGVLTHCNAGSLATVRYGTALAPIYTAHEAGLHIRVFADETRPLLQGARLTAWELTRASIDTTLICDSMASTVMASGLVDACFVGCDRVAANGDTANKIGTSGVAILAKHYGIPFYVCAPCSTLDSATPDGAAIQIEQRPAAEVTELWYASRMAPEGVHVYNPAFDVTPHDLITAFVTERGLVYPPFEQSLRPLFQPLGEPTDIDKIRKKA